jgi:hypothetical protein
LKFLILILYLTGSSKLLQYFGKYQASILCHLCHLLSEYCVLVMIKCIILQIDSKLTYIFKKQVNNSEIELLMLDINENVCLCIMAIFFCRIKEKKKINLN